MGGVIVMGLCLLVIGLGVGWGAARARTWLRLTMIGAWKEGSAERPRVLVAGRISPIDEALRAPLTGRPCVAWRVTVTIRQGAWGLGRAEQSFYSAGHFQLEDGGERFEVRLIPEHDRSDSVLNMMMIVPPWRLPPAPELDDFRVGLFPDGAPSGFQRRDEVAAVRRWLENRELDVSELEHGFEVSEAIVDTEREWLCEGPLSQGDGLPAIVADSESSLLHPSAVKLVPKKLEAEHRRRSLRQAWIPWVLFSIPMVLLPLLIFVIAIWSYLAQP